jgi:hypothetical protein
VTEPHAEIGIQPLVNWPRTVESGHSYRVTVDLRLTDPAAWPYDEEELVVGCLIDGRPTCRVLALGDAGVILHRFGGSYGPAQFLAEVPEDQTDFTDAALWLTLTTAGGVPFYTGKLPMDGSGTYAEDQTAARAATEAGGKPPPVEENPAGYGSSPGAAPEPIAVSPPAQIADTDSAATTVEEALSTDGDITDDQPQQVDDRDDGETVPLVRRITADDVPGWGGRAIDSRQVFLSHTSELARFPEERSFVAAAKDAVTRAGGVVADMKYFTAREDSPAGYCREVMRECDVYVGLIGLRYGSPVHDQRDVSYAELEFNLATEAGLPRLVFLLDENAELPASLREGNQDFRARQAVFRQRVLDSDLTVVTVASPEQLELLLFQALHEYRRVPAADVPAFVGRSDDLERLAAHLAPGAPRGGPLVLCPVNRQPGIGVTSLAVQAASRAVAAGWFSGGAMLVSPHAGGERRQLALGPTLGNVLDALGERPEQGGWGPGGEQAAYQRVMAARAAVGKPVLIVIDEVWESDARLVDVLTARGPHRLLLTAWEPPSWLFEPRRLLVDYLTEGESVDVLAAALAPDFSGSRRPPDPPAHLRVLARRCGGVAQALQTAASELAARPELSVAELLQALADTYDRGDGTAPGEQPSSLSRSLADIVRLLTPVWGPPAELLAGGRRVIGRRALLSWLRADQLSGQPGVWDVVGVAGTGKSTVLAAAQARLALAGARTVSINMEMPADSYERRRAGSGDPLVIELARTQLCTDVARAVAEKLSEAESIGIEQRIYRAEQDIQQVLDTRPQGRPDLNVADLLIPRGAGDAVAPLDPAVSEDYAGRVRAIRLELGRRVAGVLSPLSAGPGRLALLIDNLHLVTDTACRQWLADLCYERLKAVTVVARRPAGQALCAAAITYRLRDFTRAEISDYLRLVGGLDQQWVNGQVLDEFMSRTGGTPQAVAALCDELTAPVQVTISSGVEPSPPSTANFDRSLDGLDRALGVTARELVAQACQEVLGRDLPIVMDFLVVLRHVNAKLLFLVLDEEGVTRDRAGLLAARLADYSIMTTFDDAHAEGFRLNAGIRQRCLADMAPDVVRRRHERAEHVYAELVAEHEPEWDPAVADAFTPMARFESADFQGLLREWLFHAMRSQGRELSQQTGVRITQIFLEAFWWRGFYLRSPVCEQFLRELDLISADKSDADRQWLGDLSTFYRNYRWGYVYNKPGQEQRDWAEVGPAMLGLRRRAGLTQGKKMDKGRHTINVITEVYRAQAAAFGYPGEPDRAAALFADARAAVRRSVSAGNRADVWRDAWIVYFTADMWSSSGRLDKATAGLRELDALAAAPGADDLFDRELVSRTASLHGEVYLAQGAYAAAIDSCTRAALLVYAYHVSQETNEQPPNEYTYEQHRECIARARSCLAAVREQDPVEWRSGIARMCVTFAPYWRLAGGAPAGQFVAPADPPPDDWPPADGPALPEGIIPPLPDRAYLGQLDSPFTQLARQMVNELEPPLDVWTHLSGLPQGHPLGESGSALDIWVPFLEP